MKHLGILERLLAGGHAAEQAWRQFLEEYSNLFLKIIWQFEKDRDKVMETYLAVCTRFAGNDFAILRKFRQEESENPPKFSTWLAAVVRNICIDVYRTERGRRRYPRALLDLSDLDRKVFELYFWQGYALHEIEAQLRTQRAFDVAESLQRIERSLLRPSKAAQPDRRTPTIVPFTDDLAPVDGSSEEADARLRLLEQWLTQLEPTDRLVLRLRFWENLSAKEIAETMHIAGTGRIYTILRKAMRRLRSHARRAMQND